MNAPLPVLRGFHPDPSICRVGEDFYLVTSTFEFFPGVPVYHSKNLVNWTPVAHCLATKELLDLDGCAPSQGIYAPTLRYHKGRFYMTTTDVSGVGNFIVYTDDIRGAWKGPFPVDQGGIDPSLLFDDDGTVYFASAASMDDKSQIFLCEVDPDTGERLSESVWICAGTGGRCAEAPHLYKKDGWYYLLLAEGGTEYGHMVTVFRAGSPYGPYEGCPNNPVLTHKDIWNHPVQAVGHADLVEDQNGRWWCVCLGVRPLSGQLHNLGRETFLAPCRWENGWPVLGDAGTLPEPASFAQMLPAPYGEYRSGFTDDFSCQTLPLAYAGIRYIDEKKIRRNAQAHVMTLSGDGTALSTPNAAPMFLGIRQAAFACAMEAELTLGSDGKAGIAAYYGDSYYYAVFLENTDGKTVVGIEKAVHDIRVRQVFEIAEKGPVQLSIHTGKDMYAFFVRMNGEQHLLGEGAAAGLCTEGTRAKTFTGTFLGMFCERGEATFSAFSVKEEEEDDR